MKSFPYLFFLFILLGTKSFSQSVSLVDVDTNSILMRFQMPAFSIRDTMLPVEYVMPQTFSFVHVDDENFGITDSIGYPALPHYSFDVNIPYEATNISIQLLSPTFTSASVSYPLLPVQDDFRKDSVSYEFNINTNYYNSNIIYPSDNFSLVEDYMVFGERGITVDIMPCKYSPDRKTITFLSSATLQISYSVKRSETPIDSFHHGKSKSLYLESFFLNYSSEDRTVENDNYLIITAPEFEDAIQYFVDYKRDIGYNVSLVTTNTTGTSSSSILLYLKSRYDNASTRPEYVLLVGDVDKIPAASGTSYDIDDPVSDLKYALLDGTDYRADVFLGRFPVSSIQELHNIINKTIFMEMNLSDMTKRVSFLAGKEDDATMQNYFEKGHEWAIKHTFLPNGYICERLYQPTNEEAQQALSRNPIFYIYSGHGNAAAWGGVSFSVYSYFIETSTNAFFPFTFAFACKTGNFSFNNSICNKWILIQGKGAVTYFGSSVSTYCHSDYIIEKKIFGSGFASDKSISSIINSGMNQYRNYFWGWFNRKRVRRYLKSYNLLGDPSLCFGGTDCPHSIVFDNNRHYNSNEYLEYKASCEINHQGTFSLDNRASVHLRAGSDILLSDGFYATQGSDFVAEISLCNFSPRISVFNNADDITPPNNATESPNATESISQQNVNTNYTLLDVHPNPTRDLLFVELKDGVKVADITLFDMQGRIVDAQCIRPLQHSTVSLNISNLPSGIYVLRVTDWDGIQFHQKIIKR